MLAPEQVGFTSPDAPDGQLLLGLRLLRIAPEPNFRVTERVDVDSDVTRRPPLCLELRYMITPYAGEKTGYLDDHRILERVLRIFRDKPVLPSYSPYQPDVVPCTKLELMPDSGETRYYQAESQKLSLYYAAAPVPVGSDIEECVIRVDESAFGYDYNG